MLIFFSPDRNENPAVKKDVVPVLAERPEEAPFMVRKISGSGEDLKRSAGNCFGKLYSKKLKIM